jgi:hypothetical protein
VCQEQYSCRHSLCAVCGLAVAVTWIARSALGALINYPMFRRGSGDRCNWRQVQLETCAIGDMCNWRRVQLETGAIGDRCNWRHVQLETGAIGDRCNWRQVQLEIRVNMYVNCWSEISCAFSLFISIFLTYESGLSVFMHDTNVTLHF